MNLEEMLKNPDIAKKFQEFLNSYEPPKKKKGRPKKVKQEDVHVIDMTEDVSEDYEVIDLTKNNAKKNKGKMCRRVPIGPPPKNKFVDDKSSFYEDYELFDKKAVSTLAQKGKSKSGRKPIKLKIRCRECKEIKIIDQQQASVRWDNEDASTFICDDCIPQRG